MCLARKAAEYKCLQILEIINIDMVKLIFRYALIGGNVPLVGFYMVFNQSVG